eukprot:5633481-Pyramimonas_sp.AAC.2
MYRSKTAASLHVSTAQKAPSPTISSPGHNHVLFKIKSARTLKTHLMFEKKNGVVGHKERDVCLEYVA